MWKVQSAVSWSAYLVSLELGNPSVFQITFLINRVLFRVLIVLGRSGELHVLDDGLVNCGIRFSFIS